jgi:hypothetical protein
MMARVSPVFHTSIRRSAAQSGSVHSSFRATSPQTGMLTRCSGARAKLVP